MPPESPSNDWKSALAHPLPDLASGRSDRKWRRPASAGAPAIAPPVACPLAPRRPRGDRRCGGRRDAPSPCATTGREPIYPARSPSSRISASPKAMGSAAAAALVRTHRGVTRHPRLAVGAAAKRATDRPRTRRSEHVGSERCCDVGHHGIPAPAWWRQALVGCGVLSALDRQSPMKIGVLNIRVGVNLRTKAPTTITLTLTLTLSQPARPVKQHRDEGDRLAQWPCRSCLLP